MGSSKVFNKQKASSTVWYTNNEDNIDPDEVTSEVTSSKGFTLPHAATAHTALNHMDREQVVVLTFASHSSSRSWLLSIKPFVSTDIDAQSINWLQIKRRRRLKFTFNLSSQNNATPSTFRYSPHHLLSSRAKWLLGMQGNDPTQVKGRMDEAKLEALKAECLRKMSKVQNLIEQEQTSMQGQWWWWWWWRQSNFDKTITRRGRLSM